jgi:hypothetical protein
MRRIHILLMLFLVATAFDGARGQVVIKEDSVVANTVFAEIDLVDWNDHPCGVMDWWCGDQNCIYVSFEPWPLWPEPGVTGKVIHCLIQEHALEVGLQLGITYEIDVTWDVWDYGTYWEDHVDPCHLDCRSLRPLGTFSHMAGSIVPAKARTWGSIKALYGP